MDSDGLGTLGEVRAEQYLVEQGCRILARNAAFPGAEIDLIAQDGRVIVFVEVKTRTTAAYGLPCEAVERNKRRKITRVASAYLAQFDLWERPCRFDVIEVWPDDQGEPVIRHLVHAFQAERR